MNRYYRNKCFITWAAVLVDGMLAFITTDGFALCQEPGVLTKETVQKEIREGYPAHLLDLKHRDLIRSADVETLVEYKLDNNDNLSVQAAWRLALLDSSEKPESTSEEFSFFLGFLEGRCRVIPPDWWTHVLELQLGSENGRPTKTEPVIPSPSQLIAIGDVQILIPVGAKVEPAGDSVLYSDETENEIDFPNLLARNERFRGPCNLSGYFDDKYFYAVIYDEFERSAVIYCIQRDDGKTRWRKAILTSDLRNSGQGQKHGVFYSLQIQAEQLVVFGMVTNSRCEVSTFDPTTGNEKFRFSSAYESHRLR